MQKQVTITMRDLRPGFFTEDNKKCYNCKFRSSVPGSAHSSCSKESAIIEAEDHGIKMGWVMWPFDFDPVWLNSCDSFMPKVEAEALPYEETHMLLIAHLKYQMQKFEALSRRRNLSSINQAKKIMDTINSIIPILNEVDPEKDPIKKEQIIFDLYKKVVEL